MKDDFVSSACGCDKVKCKSIISVHPVHPIHMIRHMRRQTQLGHHWLQMIMQHRLILIPVLQETWFAVQLTWLSWLYVICFFFLIFLSFLTIYVDKKKENGQTNTYNKDSYCIMEYLKDTLLKCFIKFYFNVLAN